MLKVRDSSFDLIRSRHALTSFIERTLKELLSKQRSKVEEVKKKTNYYSTRNLIERYDATPADSPIRPRPGQPQGPPQGLAGTPQRSSQAPLQGPAGRQTPIARLANQGLGQTSSKLALVGRDSYLIISFCRSSRSDAPA